MPNPAIILRSHKHKINISLFYRYVLNNKYIGVDYLVNQKLSTFFGSAGDCRKLWPFKSGQHQKLLGQCHVIQNLGTIGNSLPR